MVVFLFDSCFIGRGWLNSDFLSGDSLCCRGSVFLLDSCCEGAGGGDCLI